MRLNLRILHNIILNNSKMIGLFNGIVSMPILVLISSNPSHFIPMGLTLVP